MDSAVSYCKIQIVSSKIESNRIDFHHILLNLIVETVHLPFGESHAPPLSLAAFMGAPRSNHSTAGFEVT